MPSSLSLGNACIDLFVEIEGRTISKDGILSLRAGEKCQMSDIIETCGGGACNTSVGLRRLGFSSAFGGIVGNDIWGQRIQEHLTKEGVLLESATIIEHEMSSVSFVVRLQSGERIILSNTGVNGHLHDSVLDAETLRKSDVMYLNRLAEQSCSIEDDIVRILAEKSTSFLTWNPGGCQIDRGIDHRDTIDLLQKTSLLLLNKEEALAFTHTQKSEDALDILKKMGARIVCITDGANGAIAKDDEGVYRVQSDPSIQVKDTTGAGDAFGVGMTWALFHGKKLSEALISGTLNALSVVSTIGAEAGLLTEKEITEALSKTTLTSLRVSV